jgi:hypothetical protein
MPQPTREGQSVPQVKFRERAEVDKSDLNFGEEWVKQRLQA